jgi:hypothetical protein
LRLLLRREHVVELELQIAHVLNALRRARLRGLHGRRIPRIAGIRERRHLVAFAGRLVFHLRRQDRVNLLALRIAQAQLAEAAHEARTAAVTPVAAAPAAAVTPAVMPMVPMVVRPMMPAMVLGGRTGFRRHAAGLCERRVRECGHGHSPCEWPNSDLHVNASW